MFLTVHGITGVIIGQSTSNLWLAFIIGFFSHYLLDLIPHGDINLVPNEISKKEKEVERVAKIALVDVVIMTVLLVFLHSRGLISLTLPILAGVTGSIFPDLFTGFCLLSKHPWFKKYLIFHHRLHYVSNKFNVSFKTGLVIQLIFLVTFLFFAIQF